MLIFEKSYDEVTTKLWRSSDDYMMNLWFFENLAPDLQSHTWSLGIIASLKLCK